ncbi:MAG: branched-chain-amino-acid transaminase [Chloroflexota bacterium]
MYVYLNGSLIPASEAKTSVFDHGFLYGDGIYETLRVYDGVVFMFDEHLERLHRSASLISLDIGRSPSEIRAAVYDTLSANDLRHAYLRITVSRGPGPLGLDPDLCKEPTFLIVTNAFKHYPASFYSHGVTVIVSSVRRNLREALNPQIKSLNFLNNILAKIEARQRGADEALMLNASSHIAEGTVSNVFFVSGGVLCTPAVECGILDGITRGVVINLAVRNGMSLREGCFTVEQLRDSSEVFITNTSMEVTPVAKVDDTSYPVGEVTKLLMKAYVREVAGYVKDRRGESSSLWE